MADDAAPTAYGRPLTRAEIDRVVRESAHLDLDKLDAEHLGALLGGTPPRGPAPAGRRRSSRVRWMALVVLLGLVGVVVVAGRPFGLGLVREAATAPHVYRDGNHAFLRMQPDGRNLPVGYNPCRRIPVSVNYANATPDIRRRLAEAIVEINAASGLHLDYAGATGLRYADSGRTGGIVISFASVGTESELGGGVVAYGGSASYQTATPGATTYYLGGGVTLDTDDFNPADADLQHAILLHEIGHTLGLAHVGGSTEIMNPSINRARHYQHGDLTGLALLGALPCR